MDMARETLWFTISSFNFLVMTTQAQKVLEKAMEKDFIEKPLRHDQHRAANFILLKIKKFAIKIDKLAEKVLKRKDQW